MRNYHDFIARKTRQFGSQFIATALDQRFVPYYESGQRIRVLCADGVERTGRVGVDRTRMPTFLLTGRSMGYRGPTWPLGPDDRIVAVQVAGRWRAVGS